MNDIFHGEKMRKYLSKLLIVPWIALLFCNCGQKKSEIKKTDSTTAPITSASQRMDSLQEKPKDLQPVGSATMIKFIFKKGETFGYKVHTITHVEEQTDSIKQINDQTIQYTYKFEVLEANQEGGGKLKATCTAISFHGKYGNHEMSYNSDTPPDKKQEKMFAQYNAPLNMPFEIDVNSEGTVTNVAKVDKIIERLMGNDYKTAKADAKKQVAEDYGNNALKDVIQLAFQKLSDKPVADENSWNITWTGAIGFLKVKNVATYTLQGVKISGNEKLAHIGIQMKSMYVGPPKLETGQGEATISQFDIRGTGSTQFDLIRNRTFKRTMQQILQTKLVVDPPKELKEQVPGMKLIHISQNATISTTVEML